MNKRLLANLITILALLSMLGTYGCSSGTSSPTAPGITADKELNQVETHNVWATYDLTINPDTMTIEATEQRGVDTHYDITSFISPSCVFNLITYDLVTRELIFDMEITNKASVDVYDVRALILQLPGAGYTLDNADDYTFLYNYLGTTDPNPFKAYAKLSPLRKFESGGIYTENFDITLPFGFTPPLQLKMVIECSYPGNCEDPYIIKDQAVTNPISNTIPATISLTTLDHQNNVGDVKVDTTPITGGMTVLSEVATDYWTGNVINSAGAAPGLYNCLIISDSWGSPDNLYDYVEIEVIPGYPTGSGWNGTDYNVPFGGCLMDLGVIADEGGSRDSEILTAGSNASGSCDQIIKHKSHYAGTPSLYVDLNNLDPTNDQYRPFEVLRIDAADDGAFSFTNNNWTDLLLPPPSWVYNAQVWTCFDRMPQVHTGPVPNDSRYYFDFLHNYDTEMRPADVCDDFDLGQYALFTSTYDWSPQDLIFVGTMPDSYTHDKVRYMADLDAFAGSGSGKVHPSSILGIDVVQMEWDFPTALLYVLEQSGGMPQVEVFMVMDTASGWGYDSVSHFMTIDVNYLLPVYTHVDYADGRDLEILPVNSDYELNPTDPTICVLVGWGGASSGAAGEVLLYNAMTGAFLEMIGDSSNPSLMDTQVQFLDTDDGKDWEIHVSHMDSSSTTAVRVFDYS